jgi:pimeloyl-ACP methyl ester carboxylesterase
MVTDTNFEFVGALQDAEQRRIPVEGERTLAVEVSGHGPLVLCVPGMGELRSSFRHLAPALVAAGYRVAVLDLRGHGDSDLDFGAYDDAALAADITAVIDALGGPATVIGNSMASAATVLAASSGSSAITRAVLIGPFVRNAGSPALAPLLRLALARPWGPAVWRRYHSSLSPERRAPDAAEHAARLQTSLARPGRWAAFQQTARSSHAGSEAVVAQVRIPTLVVMGEKDPDFPDPRREAEWIAAQTGGETLLVPGGGHYPMAEAPDVVTPAVLSFLAATAARG